MAHAVDRDFKVYTLALDRDEAQQVSSAIDLAIYEAERYREYGLIATLRDVQGRLLDQKPPGE